MYGLFTYIWVVLRVNVGTVNIPYIEHLGYPLGCIHFSSSIFVEAVDKIKKKSAQQELTDEKYIRFCDPCGILSSTLVTSGCMHL